MKQLLTMIACCLGLLVSQPLLAKVVYVHNDVLGSPVMRTDANGNVISRAHYKPFGETLEAAKDDVGYTGHLNDTDLGLSYMQARYYDPVIGRFYSNDPVGYSRNNPVGSFNRYSYVNNNPYKYTDPTGMCFWDACALETIAVVEGVAVISGIIVAAAHHSASTSDPVAVMNAVHNESSESNSQDGKGKKAKDSGKNSKHGKNGQAGKGDKAQDQTAELEKQLEGATGKKEKAKIKQKLKNIKKINDRKNKGEEHGKRNKK